MVRPSLLQRAERCGLVPVLAERFPETSDAADRGKEIHAAIARDDRSIPEAKAAREWMDHAVMGELHFERRLSLVDLDTMEVLTEGTADLIANCDEYGTVVVVDWKSGIPDNVAEPDDNLQLLAYGLAACEGHDFRVVLVFLDGDRADDRWSRNFSPEEHDAIQARVAAVCHAEPVAKPGEYCQSCYQRVYCDAWKARLSSALTVLPAESKALAVTDENAPAIAERIKAVREAADLAEEALRAHVLGGGRCVLNGKEYVQSTSDGRESVDVKAVKEAGLMQFIKRGQPFATWRWRKAKQ